MATFTVFYRHPYHMPSWAHYSADYASAEAAGVDALDMLPEDLFEDDEPAPDADPDELSDYRSRLEAIRDDLEIVIYGGEHATRPSGPPLHTVE